MRHDAGEPLGSSVEGDELAARPVVDLDFLERGLDGRSGSFHDRFTSCWRSLVAGVDGVLPSMRSRISLMAETSCATALVTSARAMACRLSVGPGGSTP